MKDVTKLDIQVYSLLLATYRLLHTTGRILNHIII